MASCARLWVLGLLLGAAACGGDDGASADDEGDGSTSGGDADAGDGAQSGPDPDSDSGGPTDCVAGQIDCVCLDDACVGGAFCIDGTCLPGPEIELPDDLFALAGMRVRLEATVTADSFSWEQVDGPTVELLDPTLLELDVDVPSDVPAGSTITLRLTAERNTVSESADTTLTILPVEVTDALPEISDPQQLSAPSSLAVGDADLWVASSEGFIARFDQQGAFAQRYDFTPGLAGIELGQRPVGEDTDIDVLYTSTGPEGSVLALEIISENTPTITDSISGGGALGEVDDVVADRNGDLYFLDRAGGRLLFYDSEEQMTVEVLADFVASPSALVYGPEDNDVLYVGGVGQVVRVPMMGDGIAGQTSVYVDLGPTDDPLGEVDGLVFDEAANLWIGTPGTSTLALVRYVADGSTEVARTIDDVEASLAEFVGLHFGDDGFGRSTLYWVNPSSGKVAKLETGVAGD